MAEPVDQPIGLRIADKAARCAAGQQEFDQRLDEEIGPFTRPLRQIVVQCEQRIGFARLDAAVAPARTAQRQNFLIRDNAIGDGLIGQRAELIGHALQTPCHGDEIMPQQALKPSYLGRPVTDGLRRINAGAAQ